MNHDDRLDGPPWWARFLCRIGHHHWTPWQLEDDALPTVRLYVCGRCGSIES